jgi:hypothetical protein
MTRTLEALAPLLDEAGGDADRFRQNVETWFNDGMDRVSGWYKRHTAYWQGVIALLIAILLNVDALLITRTLWREPTLRRSLVASAEAHEARGSQPAPGGGETAQTAVPTRPDQQFADLQAQMQALGVPIGWSCEEKTIANWLWCAGRKGSPGQGIAGPAASAVMSPRSEQGWLAMIVGWLIMAAAASLGAPFWFDTLKRVMSVRSGGKSPDEQPSRRSSGSAPR